MPCWLLLTAPHKSIGGWHSWLRGNLKRVGPKSSLCSWFRTVHCYFLSMEILRYYSFLIGHIQSWEAEQFKLTLFFLLLILTITYYRRTEMIKRTLALPLPPIYQPIRFLQRCMGAAEHHHHCLFVVKMQISIMWASMAFVQSSGGMSRNVDRIITLYWAINYNESNTLIWGKFMKTLVFFKKKSSYMIICIFCPSDLLDLSQLMSIDASTALHE